MSSVFPMTDKAVTDYLEEVFGGPVRLISLSAHKPGEAVRDLKEFGYGLPVFLEFEAAGKQHRAVLETMAPSSYGHDHFSDRAQAILWEHSAFNALPRHVRSLDCGAFLASGSMLSTGQAREFFLLTEFVEGLEYNHDLERIRETGLAESGDLERTRVLSDYLADLHAQKKEGPSLYRRRIRELLGHGECIMGLIDNYPNSFEFIDQHLLQSVERLCWDWRWKVRGRTHRLCTVHGDFHPWNILFRHAADFTVLDRSRGEWGDPADDTSCLSINYLFSSLLRSGKLEGAFSELFDLFWNNYLSKTGDQEMLEVVAPFFAFRGLVIAHPVWYPHLPGDLRLKIFHFIRNILSEKRFETADVNRYLK